MLAGGLILTDTPLSLGNGYVAGGGGSVLYDISQGKVNKACFSAVAQPAAPVRSPQSAGQLEQQVVQLQEITAT